MNAPSSFGASATVRLAGEIAHEGDRVCDGPVSKTWPNLSFAIERPEMTRPNRGKTACSMPRQSSDIIGEFPVSFTFTHINARSGTAHIGRNRPLKSTRRSGLLTAGAPAHSLPMGSKSRESIYGASIRASAERAKEARKEADRAELFA
jgi:hypothetical protein